MEGNEEENSRKEKREKREEKRKNMQDSEVEGSDIWPELEEAQCHDTHWAISYA